MNAQIPAYADRKEIILYLQRMGIDTSRLDRLDDNGLLTVADMAEMLMTRVPNAVESTLNGILRRLD